MSGVWVHLFPQFDAWWPNIYAWLIQTPLVALAVWAVHRSMRGRTLVHIRTELAAHRAAVAADHEQHRAAMAAMLAAHQVAVTGSAPVRPGDPTIGS